MIEKTFVAIKPDGVQRGLVGEILQRFERAGLAIVAMKLFWANKDFAQKHYSAHIKKPFYPGLEKYITEGPVVALVLEGVHAIEVVRKMNGPTEPLKAAPGTIRGDFASHSYQYADAKQISVKNLIHSSESKSDAEKEIALWFKPDELYSYNVLNEIH